MNSEFRLGSQIVNDTGYGIILRSAFEDSKRTQNHNNRKKYELGDN